MYKLCKTELSALRQRQIEDALLEMMLQHQYEDISVSDLCEKMEIPRKAFYRYFDSKDGCLHALLDHRLMEYEVQENKNQRVVKAEFQLDLDWFFTFWYNEKKLLDALTRSGLSGILVESTIRHSWEANIFEFPPYTPEYIKSSTAFIVCGLMSLVLQWHQDGYRQSSREMAETTWQLLSKPLIPGITL